MGAYPLGRHGQRFNDLTHAEREELALERGQVVHGMPYRSELRSSFSVGWGQVPHIDEAWSNWTGSEAAYQSLLRGNDRWFFAGDWLSRAPGWQHGALASARRSVTALHERALAAN